MEKRLAVRLLLVAIVVDLILISFLVIRQIQASLTQTTQWLESAHVVNRIRGNQNHSGVPDTRTRVIVMAKLSSENTTWVEHELPQWQRAIYTVDDKRAELHTEVNKGREANVYLTYLIQNYESLADFMVFLHSHRDGFPRAWHNDNEAYSNVLSVRSLRLDYVERTGYANLRCLHSPGCPDGLVPFRSPPNAELKHETVFPDAWLAMMGTDKMPTVIGVPCCSQFAVSKEQVLKRPRTDYQRYHKWLMETELPDDVSGRVMEYMWHIIFGQDAVQ